MAGSVLVSPGFNVQPSAEKVALTTNYITNFDFLNQYLPDVYEEEFERYGNRSVQSFLRMVSAEIPSTSDLIKWTEQGRLHIIYTDCQATTGAVTDTTATIQINDTLDPGTGTYGIKKNQTVFISDNSAGGGSNRAIVTGAGTADGLSANEITVAYYEEGGQAFAGTGDAGERLTIFVYGSEFNKGTGGIEGSNESFSEIFENSPVILKDKYEVNGSDMAQIGWVDVTSEDGASGYLWFIKSMHDARLRFEDHMETNLIEAHPAQSLAGGDSADSGAFTAGYKGTEGVFFVIGERGNVWSGGYPDTLTEFDTVVQRLDKQGAIEENVIYLNRGFSFAIDDMLAQQNSYGVGGTSFGLFDNEEQMALNLGFTGFRRGYDFYKSEWRYLIDPTMRGGIVSGTVNGLMIPAGTTTVYDQVLGKNAKRPFLHVRYRKSEREDRRYKTWIIGSAGGADNSDIDAMTVHMLTERCMCTMGANNFFIIED